MKLKLASVFLAIFLMFSFASAYTLGDGTCLGYENKIYAYDFNETPSGDWGYVEKLGDQNIDYNVEIVNSSYHPDINGTALHFNATSTGNNDGILFSYQLHDVGLNFSLGFPITTVEFDLYNVTMVGMTDWHDVHLTIRQVDWTEGTVLEYSFIGIPNFYDNGEHFHAVLNSIRHNDGGRGYACSVWDYDTGDEIEFHGDFDCPYEIDTEFSSFYLVFANDGDSDLELDFVIDNLVVSQYENVFNSPVDCMGKEGFPYVNGYVLNNQAEQGFTDAVWVDGVPVAYYRCQVGLDNNFGLEEYYDTDFLPNQPEYSDITQLYSDYPEDSMIWYDVVNGSKDYHTQAYMTFRNDVLFFGDYDGCVDVHNLCQNLTYQIAEEYAGDFQYWYGYLYNNTDYNPVHINKTPTYYCGSNDTYDNLETSDVIIKTDNSFLLEPFDYSEFGFGDFRFEWMPFRDYDTCWDCFHPNTTAYWEKRILDNETGLCGYFADLGITPCPYETLDDYLYCNARWNIDRDFAVETGMEYQNYNVETIHPFTNQSNWIDLAVALTNYTWFNNSYALDYMPIWNTTIAEFYDFGLCRFDLYDYAPFNYLDAGTKQRQNNGYSWNGYSLGVGNGLNSVRGGLAYTYYLPNNFTIDKQDYYIVEEHPFKYVYKFVRELDPMLEVVKHVSIEVPIETNVTSWNKFKYYDSSGDELSFVKFNSTYSLLEDVSESHPTWTNSPENYTVEFTVCKEGMFYDEMTEDCYDTPTFYAIIGGRNTGFLSALLGIGMIVVFAYVFVKKGGKE